MTDNLAMTGVGVDMRDLDFRSGEELKVALEHVEREIGEHVDKILLHLDQEKWLKFDLYQRGMEVPKSRHIDSWHGRRIVLTDTWDGHPCNDCGTIHE
jgi:hypothetical protein